MTVKTIAFLTPLYFSDESCVGGGERYPHNMAVGLVQAAPDEFRVELLSYGPRPFRKQLHPGVGLRVMEAGPAPRNSLDNVSWDITEALAEVDLVHVHQLFTRGSELAYVAAKLAGIPICGSDHGGPTSPIARQFGGLELIDQIVAYSEFGRKTLATDRPVALIKGGVDAETFRPPAVRRERDRFVFVGRFLPHKGIDRLIEALPADLPLICCGRPYNEDYYGRLKELARGKRVEFLLDGDDAAIQEQYSRAWAVVLPSCYVDCYGNTYLQPELMGFTLLEAMACGTPAICARVGGMPEFVDHGRTGFVFDTTADLTGYLKRLATEPGLSESMGRSARAAVEAEFDRRVCGAKLATIYRGLLGDAAVPARGAA